MKVFLGTDLLLPLMKNIVAPLFEDEEFLNMVIEAMKSDPQFGGMAGMMVPTLKLLPEIIKNEMPSAAIPIVDTCRTIEIKLFTVKKLPLHSIPKKIIKATRISWALLFHSRLLDFFKNAFILIVPHFIDRRTPYPAAILY